MIPTTIEGSVPALARVVPNPIGDLSEFVSTFEEERDGNFFRGLFFAMVAYVLLALGIAMASKLYHLLS